MSWTDLKLLEGKTEQEASSEKTLFLLLRKCKFDKFKEETEMRAPKRLIIWKMNIQNGGKCSDGQ